MSHMFSFFTTMSEDEKMRWLSDMEEMENTISSLDKEESVEMTKEEREWFEAEIRIAEDMTSMVEEHPWILEWISLEDMSEDMSEDTSEDTSEY